MATLLASWRDLIGTLAPWALTIIGALASWHLETGLSIGRSGLSSVNAPMNQALTPRTLMGVELAGLAGPASSLQKCRHRGHDPL